MDNRAELYKGNGRFLFIAAKMREAIDANKEVVNDFKMSCDAASERQVREIIFHHMMRSGKGRFDPIEIRRYVEMEINGQC